MKRYSAVAVLSVLALCALTPAQSQRARPQRPYVVGVVTTVGGDGMTLTIKSPGQLAPVTVTSDGNTKLYQGVDVPVAQLKVGDSIVVNGMPLKLRALSLQVGTGFDQLMSAALGKPISPAQQVRPRAVGTVIGTVASLQPLTVRIGNLSVEIETNARTVVVTFQAMVDTAAIRKASKLIAVGPRTGNNLAARLLVLDRTAQGLQPVTSLGGYVGRLAKPRRPATRPKPPVTPAPAPTDQTPAPTDQQPAPADQTPAPADQQPAPADQTPADQTPADQTPADQTPAPGGDQPGGDQPPAPADQPPAPDAG
jgi:hypothetical protein